MERQDGVSETANTILGRTPYRKNGGNCRVVLLGNYTFSHLMSIHKEQTSYVNTQGITGVAARPLRIIQRSKTNKCQPLVNTLFPAGVQTRMFYRDRITPYVCLLHTPLVKQSAVVSYIFPIPRIYPY